MALIAREDDAYGQTFIDWFAFQAKELGIVNCGVFTYADGDCSQMKMALESGSDCVICASTMEEDIAKMIEARNSVQKSTGRYIRTLFSDSVFTPGFIERFGTVCEGMEGVMYSSDPESGFDVAYQVMFNEDSSCGEAQTYDACMLIGLATMMQRLDGSLDFKSAMRKLVSGRTPVYGTWTAAGMAAFTTSIAAGENPDIIGASGNLNFESKVFTNVLSTTYCNYIINNLRYVIINYNSTSGGTRTDPTLAGWNWKAKQMQEIGQRPDVALPELDQRWALLAATSKGWENYRHQADVLNMYRILRKNGYDDDHIVLIIEDDIADNAVCSGLSSPAIAVEWPLPLTPIIASLPSPRQMPMRLPRPMSTI